MRRLTTDESSNVSAVTLADSGELEVEFRGGAIYRYSGTSAQDFHDACQAQSLGRWVHQRLVKAGLTARRVGDAERLPADPMRLAVQLVASIGPSAPGAAEAMNGLARQALLGAQPPPMPPDWPAPRVEPDPRGNLVAWDVGSIELDVEDDLARMTADQAVAVAHALLRAAALCGAGQ